MTKAFRSCAARSRLDSVRAAVADSTNRDALGYGLFINSEISTLLSVVEAAIEYRKSQQVYDEGSLKDRVPNGIKINEWRARLDTAITAVKGN